MDIWRLIATVLMTFSGGLLVAGSIGQARDNVHRYGNPVARTALGGIITLAFVVTLVATVLPGTMCWALIVASVIIASILMVTG